MFDFHSHILPNIDDGSRSVEESICMLRECARQGISGMAATPHFYADRTTPEEFVKQREMALQRLEEKWEENLPPMKAGAEILYYDGICRSDEVLKLRLEGTNILLVEMPMTCWNSRMQNEIIELNCKPGVTVVLAHIERYFMHQPVKTWKILCHYGIYMQSNASFILQRATRKKAMHMLKNGSVHVIASDCHNMTDRRPCLGQAMEMIKQTIGIDVVHKLLEHEEVLLNESL